MASSLILLMLLIVLLIPVGRATEVDAKGVDLGGVRPSFRLVPVQLDVRGFPQIVASDEAREARFTNRRTKADGGVDNAAP